MPKPEVLVSSDAIGLFGSFEQLAQIYAQSLPFLGSDKIAIEMIAWKHLTISQKNYPIHKDISIVGIHGPIGNPSENQSVVETSTYLLFNNLLEKLDSLLKIKEDLFDYKKSRNYLLVHELELRNPKKIQFLIDANSSAQILVENVLEKGSLEKTIKTVNLLKSRNVSSGIMIDLVHLLKEYTQFLDDLHPLEQKVFDQAWQKSLENSYQAINKLPVSGFHIPIGTNEDSLPLQLMTKKHWQDLSQVIKSLDNKVCWITLENQQKEAIRIKEKSIPIVAKRNKNIIAMLAENEVV